MMSSSQEEKDDDDEEEEHNPADEENPYYITLESADQVMPDHCVFGTMSRDDAERCVFVGC